ncbi:hypothetical protein GGP77_002295 [Salinibacter ruber]|nr:hypothetical protein [Salinibacter ruber]
MPETHVPLLGTACLRASTPALLDIGHRCKADSAAPAHQRHGLSVREMFLSAPVQGDQAVDVGHLLLVFLQHGLESFLDALLRPERSEEVLLGWAWNATTCVSRGLSTISATVSRSSRAAVSHSSVAVLLTSPPAEAGRFSCGLLCPYPTGLPACLQEPFGSVQVLLAVAGLHCIFGRYRMPVGEAMTDRLGPSPATWVEPVGSSPGYLSFRIFRAPTTSRCASNEHCGQSKSLPFGLCLCSQLGYVCDV